MRLTKRLEWSEEKNRQLQLERDISFEAIELAIHKGQLLDFVPHPQKKYAHQKLLMIDWEEEYILVVPCVEDTEKLFLKTAYFSRKATKYYLRGGNEYAKEV